MAPGEQVLSRGILQAQPWEALKGAQYMGSTRSLASGCLILLFNPSLRVGTHIYKQTS